MHAQCIYVQYNIIIIVILTDRTSPLHCCLMPTMMLLTVGKEMFMLLDSLKMFAKIGEYAFISTA